MNALTINPNIEKNKIDVFECNKVYSNSKSKGDKGLSKYSAFIKNKLLTNINKREVKTIPNINLRASSTLLRSQTIIKAKSISGATVADVPAIEKSRNLNNDIPAVIFPCIRIPARNM
ncbi:MAG: hypothetical protein MIO93_00875 [ANME-2 cluster archaeon]|jgi:hypothetical protein|nr:hypothetical protein [ANME-2 cluster archaeon]